MKYKKVGEVAVETGQVMVVDPCFAGPRPADAEAFGNDGMVKKHRKRGKLPFSFDGAVQATLRGNGAGQLHFKNGVKAAVVSCTGVGDGSFPVFLVSDSQGRPQSLIIDFAHLL